MNRREIRDHIFKLLFIKDFNQDKSIEDLASIYFKYLPYFDDEDEVSEGYELYTDITTTSIYDFLNAQNEIDMDNLYIKEILYRTNEILNHKKELIDIKKNVYNEKDVGWKFNRIMNIDLLILIIATYEIKYMKDIDMQVSINEAVLLAKCYGYDGKGKTINGILREVYKFLNNDIYSNTN